MSDIDKDKKEEEDSIKLKNPFKTMLGKEELEESPEEIIAKDTDLNRKELFKKTYEALVAMYPEADKKKKKKKEKEKQEIKQRTELQLSKDSIERQEKAKEDKGIERER